MTGSIQRTIEEFQAAKLEKKDDVSLLFADLEDEFIAFFKQRIGDNDKLDIDKTIDEELKILKDNLVLDEEEIKALKNNISAVVSIFEDLEPVRRDEESAISFLRECVQRIVVYDEPDFIDEYEKFGIKDRQTMRKVCYAVKNIYYSHTMNRLSPASAEKQIKALFELSDSVANLYRTLYEINYDKLTMNVILSKLNRSIQE